MHRHRRQQNMTCCLGRALIAREYILLIELLLDPSCDEMARKRFNRSGSDKGMNALLLSTSQVLSSSLMEAQIML
eukprot:scaffold8637_cov153-Skeletonema_dohrnii-CCMP3373.AAC.9